MPRASVRAKIPTGAIVGETDDRGVATLPMTNHDELQYLTAWTEDFKVGGYDLNRNPPRDPLGDDYTVELVRCRSQKVRIINDKDKTPVPNLNFTLVIGTGEPDFQYLRESPGCELKTNAAGEAVCRWFPDWKKHRSYIEISDRHWVRAGDPTTVDGALVVRLRPSRLDSRKRVFGTVTCADGNLAGFCVSITTFQAEEKGHFEPLCAFTGERGRFAADYLPGATYCMYVNDARFVSNTIDLIPFDPTTGKTNAPSLAVRPGQPVAIVATAGPSKQPIAHQRIVLSAMHDSSWREGGETRRGRSGRRWDVITDEQGRATTFALPGGEIEASIWTPQWQQSRLATVKADGVTRLEFHRKLAGKRSVRGRLLLADNLRADLNEAAIAIGALDGETEERFTLKADRDGKFEFQSQATRVGIYVRTKDCKAAGVSVVDRLDGPIQLQLKPTVEYRGQLLGRNGRPYGTTQLRISLPGRTKRIRQPGRRHRFWFRCRDLRSQDGRRRQVRAEGTSLRGQVKPDRRPPDRPDQVMRLGDIYLVPNKPRPFDVSRLWQPPPTKTSFSQR